jgi:hypothetical protein
MNLGVELVYLLPTLMSNWVILERGLNPLIFSVFFPLFPWEGLWSIVIRSPETSTINILADFCTWISLLTPTFPSWQKVILVL